MKQRDLFGELTIETKSTGALDLAKVRKPLTKNYRSSVEDVYQKAGTAAQAIQELRPNLNHKLLTDPNDLVTYMKTIKRSRVVALDTETSGLDPRLADMAGISLYTPNSDPVYIPVGHHYYLNNVPGENVRAFLRELDELVRKNEVTLIMHNSKYDVQAIMKYAQVWLLPQFDTLVASVLLNENEPHGLKALWNKYCMGNKYSGDAYDDLFENRKYNTFNPEKVYIYATLDAVMTYELYVYQKQFLSPGSPYNKRYNLEGVTRLFIQEEMPVIRIATEMEWVGIAFDTELNRELQKQYEFKIKTLTRSFQARVRTIIEERKDSLSPEVLLNLPDPININSANQMSVLFYDVMGMELDESTKRQVVRAKNKNSKSGEADWRSVGKVALKNLKQNYPEHKELFDEYDDIKETVKVYTGFIVGLRQMVSPVTGRVHGGWNPTGTVTGRFSSNRPNL